MLILTLTNRGGKMKKKVILCILLVLVAIQINSFVSQMNDKNLQLECVLPSNQISNQIYVSYGEDSPRVF